MLDAPSVPASISDGRAIDKCATIGLRKRIVPGGAAGLQTRLGALCASGWVRLPFSSATNPVSSVPRALRRRLQSPRRRFGAGTLTRKDNGSTRISQRFHGNRPFGGAARRCRRRDGCRSRGAAGWRSVAHLRGRHRCRDLAPGHSGESLAAAFALWRHRLSACPGRSLDRQPFCDRHLSRSQVWCAGILRAMGRSRSRAETAGDQSHRNTQSERGPEQARRRAIALARGNRPLSAADLPYSDRRHRPYDRSARSCRYRAPLRSNERAPSTNGLSSTPTATRRSSVAERATSGSCSSPAIWAASAPT